MKSTLYGPRGRFGGERPSHFSYNVGVDVTLNVSPTFGIGVGGAYHSIESNRVRFSPSKLFTVGVSLMRRTGAK